MYHCPQLHIYKPFQIICSFIWKRHKTQILYLCAIAYYSASQTWRPVILQKHNWSNNISNPKVTFGNKYDKKINKCCSCMVLSKKRKLPMCGCLTENATLSSYCNVGRDYNHVWFIWSSTIRFFRSPCVLCRNHHDTTYKVSR